MNGWVVESIGLENQHILLKISWVRIPLHPKKRSYFFFVMAKISFEYHWHDLKTKLYFVFISFIITFLISFIFRTELFYFLGQVFIQFQKNIIFTKLSTGFWVYFQLAWWSSLFFLLPLILYFTFLFLLKGFLQYKSIFYFTLSILFFLFFSYIIIFNLYYIFPFIFSFFLNFESTTSLISVQLEARFDQYISFLINYFLVILSITVVPFLILIINFFFIKKLKQIRCNIYLPLFFFFLLIAPPDLLLQLLLFLFLLILIEVFLFLFFLIDNFFKNLIEESRIRTYDE